MRLAVNKRIYYNGMVAMSLNKNRRVLLKMKRNLGTGTINMAAIERATEIVERIDRQLRRRLTGNQLFENTHIAKQVERREQGVPFSLTDHIRGMAYAMLSSNFPWKRIAGEIDEQTGQIIALDEILYHYECDKLLAADPQALLKKITEHKWGNPRIAEQLHGLIHVNIQKLIAFQEKEGDIDTYYQQFIEEDSTFKSLITNLSAAGSKDKFVEMGESLTAEYLRNIGYDMSKPDRHICRILGANHLGCSDRKTVPVFEAMEIVRQIAMLCNRHIAEIDYILWSYCATGYGEICTAQRPMCWVCLASDFCARAQQAKKAWLESDF